MMAEWTRVANLDELTPGTGKEVVVGGNVVALFRVGDECHALDGMCPHAGGPLADGGVDGVIVTCPWHGWQFDVTTGAHCLNRRLIVRRFPTRVVNNEVFVSTE